MDKSTVPVGTAEKVEAAIASNTNIEFAVVSNPEFLRQGFAVSDFMKPDRVVLGTSSERAMKVMEKLYKPFVGKEIPFILWMKNPAELTKYAANSFLATKITFMNEVANFCELIGADVDMVRGRIGSDKRIGITISYIRVLDLVALAFQKMFKHSLNLVMMLGII